MSFIFLLNVDKRKKMFTLDTLYLFFPAPGQFQELTTDEDTSRILKSMYQAVEKYELWELFQYNKQAIDIMTQLDFIPITKELEPEGHSGASMTFCVNHMKLLKRIGWNAYCVYMIENQ